MADAVPVTSEASEAVPEVVSKPAKGKAAPAPAAPETPKGVPVGTHDAYRVDN